MTIEKIEEAHAILGHIKELETSIETGSLDLTTVIDWRQGCAVEPHITQN